MDDIRKRALDALASSGSGEEPKTEDVQQTEAFSDTEQPQEMNTDQQVLENNDTTEESTGEVESEQSFELTDDAVFKYLSEKQGLEIKSFDDLVKEKVVEVEKEVERQYFSEDAKGYDKYSRETGRTLEDYLMLKRDVDSLPKEKVVRESLKLEYPDLSKEHLDRLYNKRFGIDEIMDDDEKADRELEREIAYSKGIKSLKQQQESYLVPKEDSVASIEAKQQEERARVEEANKSWVETVGKTNSEITGIEVDLGDGFKFTHTINDENRVNVKEIAQDPTLGKYFNRYKNEDGSWDAKKYQRDIYILENLSSILSDVRNHEKASTIEQIEKSDRNINFKSDQKPVVKAELSKKQQEALDLYKKRYNKR